MKLIDKIKDKLKKHNLYFLKMNGVYYLYIDNNTDFLYETNCKKLIEVHNFVEYEEGKNIYERIKKEKIKNNYENLKNILNKY